METLFRLILTRPAVDQSEDRPSIRLTEASGFQAALGVAQKQENPREAMKEVARQFVASAEFVGGPEDVQGVDKLKMLSAGLNTLEKKQNVTNGDVAKMVEDIYDANPANLVKNKTLEPAIVSLKDAILAIKLLPEEHHRRIEDITNQLRDLEIVARVAATAAFPGTGAVLRAYRRRSVMLPSESDLKSSLTTVQKQIEMERKRKEEEEKKREQAETKLARYHRIETAVDELTSLGGEHLQTTEQKGDNGFLVPSNSRPLQVKLQALQQGQQLSQIKMLRSNLMLGKSAEGKGGDSGEEELVDNLIETATTSKQRFFELKGSTAFKPIGLSEIGFRLKSSAEKLLSASTLDLLREMNLSLTGNSLDHIIAVLRTELTRLAKELDGLLGRPVKHTFKRMGKTMVMIKSPMPSVWNAIVMGGMMPTTHMILDGRIPHSHGSVAPAGVADLLIVKQQLLRYESADVAHIENVLKGESKEREHIRRRETEELIFRESETTTSEERELSSTDRFEMTKESSETIREELSLKAGLQVSGKYGPVVEFAVSAEGSYSRTKEEATKSASRFSQEVTQRSSQKITERVLERTSLRITNEVTETNRHGINNVAGAEHIAGVYQWANKVYQAQMFNYGIRTMFDFMVPEPAAFLIEAMQNEHASAIALEKPIDFTLRPDQITESNYHTWVKEYGATDVTPPPEMYKTKSLDFKASGGNSDTDYNHSGQLSIDDGYKAVHGSVGWVGLLWEDNYVLDVVLGSRSHRFNKDTGWVWSTTLSEETDSIPFVANSFNLSQVAVAVEVKCQRTDRVMMKWKLETHAKLTTAFKARMAEYEEKLAQLEMQAGVAIQGKNPALNQELMRDELKKNCISILTEQHFDLFDAISTGSNGLPQIDLYENKAEGPYVRFFEQAFEWEHMTWVTYPYFWGRKSEWRERISYEDTDTAFNEFLKAGYCRVVVPARPSFEGAIDHFMQFGETWDGGPLPPISSPLYLPIADEIAERLDRPGSEIPQGDPWLVHVPTTLVHLRPDDKLPQWEQNDEGEWIEVEGD